MWYYNEIKAFLYWTTIFENIFHIFVGILRVFGYPNPYFLRTFSFRYYTNFIFGVEFDHLDGFRSLTTYISPENWGNLAYVMKICAKFIVRFSNNMRFFYILHVIIFFAGACQEVVPHHCGFQICSNCIFWDPYVYVVLYMHGSNVMYTL